MAVYVSPVQGVIVKNFSFETPVTGGFTDDFNAAINNPSNANFWGWGYFFDSNNPGDKDAGVQTLANGGITSGATGSQDGWVNGEGSYLYQDVGTLLASKNYHLTVSVAGPGTNSYGGTGQGNSSPMAQLSLWNGANPIPSTGTLGVGASGTFAVSGTQLGLLDVTPAEGVLADNTLNFTSSASVSGDLIIVLKQTQAGLHQQANFDNIRLTYDGEVAPSPTWNIAGSGDWNVANNWSTATIPNAVGAEADFFSALTAPHTIFTDAGVTVGTMRFNNTNTYVISGAGALTLQNTGTSSALIDVQAGTHKFSLPITIASNTNFNVAGGANLVISNPVTVNSGKSITQTGTGSVTYQSTVTVQSAGAIAFGNSSHMAGLALQGTSNASMTAHAGSTPNVLQIDSLSINPTSKLDLANNTLLTNTTPAGMRSLLQSGSIYTSMAAGNHAVGYNDAGGGQVRATYALSGDADLNGTVNLLDFNALAGAFSSTNRVWVNGDFNYDGVVNLLDLNAIATNYGQTLSSQPALGALVPEPTSLATLALIGGLLRTRKRRR
jgi:hypothetical protein